jgi:hypothetical protein
MLCWDVESAGIHRLLVVFRPACVCLPLLPSDVCYMFQYCAPQDQGVFHHDGLSQVELKGDQPSAEGVRKRDMLFKVFGRATTSLTQVAEQVYKHEAVQKATAQFSGAVAGTGEKWQNAQTTIGELRAATGAKVGEMQAVISTRAEVLGQLTAERRDQYKGWVMEKMVTPAAGAAAAVGFFLARTEGRESSFDACRKQERVEVVDISARNCIKTTLIVQPGDTLNWTFGALLS